MRILLDTSAILELFTGGQTADTVRKLILESAATHTSVLNVYELVYMLSRLKSAKQAEESIQALKTDTIVLPIDESAAVLAGKIRLEHPKLSAVDCNTWAVARQKDLKLVTKDWDFPKDRDIIRL